MCVLQVIFFIMWQVLLFPHFFRYLSKMCVIPVSKTLDFRFERVILLKIRIYKLIYHRKKLIQNDIHTIFIYYIRRPVLCVLRFRKIYLKIINVS